MTHSASLAIIPQYTLEGIEVLPSESYYSFPEVISTFAYSKPGSCLLRLNMMEAVWYLRKEKTQATLIHWEGEKTEKFYHMATLCLKNLGITRFNSLLLPECLDYIRLVKASVWYSFSSWQNSELSANKRWQIRSALRRYRFVEVSRDEIGQQQMFDILERWYEKAKERHFMVVRGHYRAMIRAHCHFANSRMFFALNGNGIISGLVGGYVYSGVAVITQAKHDYSSQFLSKAIWAFWMSFVHDDLGISVCCCGDTADNLKEGMGMQRRMAYRIPHYSLMEA